MSWLRPRFSRDSAPLRAFASSAQAFTNNLPQSFYDAFGCRLVLEGITDRGPVIPEWAFLYCLVNVDGVDPIRETVGRFGQVLHVSRVHGMISQMLKMSAYDKLYTSVYSVVMWIIGPLRIRPSDYGFHQHSAFYGDLVEIIPFCQVRVPQMKRLFIAHSTSGR